MIENLPDDGDILNYPGVTKEILLHACEDIRLLANEISTQDGQPHFAIISLKRFEAKVYEDLKDFLESGVKSEKANDKFDKFLTQFSKLYEHTKQTYFIVNQNGLRNEKEISVLRESIAQLDIIKSELEGKVQELTELFTQTSSLNGESKQALDEVIQNTEKLLEESTQKSDEILLKHQTALEQANTIDAIHEKIDGWDSEIEAYTANIAANQGTIETQAGAIKKLDVAITATESRASSVLSQAETFEQKNRILLTEIEATLGGANRFGMSASFRRMKVEMERIQRRWQQIFILSISLFSLLTASIVIIPSLTNSFSWIAVLTKLPLVSPLVWLGWFSARQYSVANRVREDYAFKFTASMAYEGYRKAALDTDPEIAKELMRISVFNFAQNPVRLYEKAHSDHATPLSEFLEKLLHPFKKAKIQTPHATVELESDASK